MMGVINARRPQHGDITQIPTPPLQAAALFITIFFPVLALFAVSLRLYARHMMRQLAIDDWLLVAALLFSLAMVVPFYFYIKLNYFGWHAVDVPMFDPAPGRWWFYLAQIFYNPVLALVKASLLLFLLRLGGHRRSVRWVINGLLTFNGLMAIAVFFVAVFQCIPIEANWDPAAAATAKCVHLSFHVIVSGITLFTDILVLIIPFWIFLGLKLPLAARIAVIGVFLTGIGVTIIGAIRLANIYKLFFGPPNTHDDPYYNIGITLNTVEINLAIVSGSVPALRPLFRKWFPSLYGGSSQNYNKSDENQYQTNSKYARGTGKGGPHSGNNSGLHHGGGGGGGGSIGLKNLSRNQHTEIRGVSPSDSQEEIMTSNGIMRTTDVHVSYYNSDENTLQASDSRSSSDEFKRPNKVASPRGLSRQ